MRILVIIPAYNEEKNIIKVIEDISKNAPNCDYIVINDASTDNTDKILDNNNIKHITLLTNLGLNGAVQTGIKYANYMDYDCCVQFDGDGQHLASYIKYLEEQIKSGTNIAIGSRFLNSKKNMSLRMIGSRLITFLIKVKTQKKITDPTSGFRMYDKKIIQKLADDIYFRPEPDAVVRLIKSGYKVDEVQVEMREREYGESLFNSPLSSIKYMIKMIIAIVFLS